MIGEALREAGTLVIVFAPLYVIFEHSAAVGLHSFQYSLPGSRCLFSA
jgi:hypothetical protein